MRPLFTRRHYRALAESLGQCVRAHHLSGEHAWAHVYSMCALLARDNPRFKRETFLGAVRDAMRAPEPSPVPEPPAIVRNTCAVEWGATTWSTIMAPSGTWTFGLWGSAPPPAE